MFRKNVELQPVQNALVSEVTADVFKKNDLWQVAVKIVLEIFGTKDEGMNNSARVICTLNHISNDSVFTNLVFRNNLANATVILNVPFVSIS